MSLDHCVIISHFNVEQSQCRIVYYYNSVTHDLMSVLSFWVDIELNRPLSKCTHKVGVKASVRIEHDHKLAPGDYDPQI